MEYLDFAVEIANYAKGVILEYFNRKDVVSFKSDLTAVTIADKKINSYLIDRVKEVYPAHSVCGEEMSYDNASDFVWVCDPIDGTGMFTNGIPVSVFSLALVVSGDVLVGVLYDAFLDKLYTAVRGHGAYCNGVAIHVNNKKYGEVGYRLNYEAWSGAEFDVLSMIRDMQDNCCMSSIGSVARSCMAIAEGSFSCDIFPGTTHGNCDIAASSLIVEEAGGKVTDMYGNHQKYDKGINGAIISNGVSHDDVLKRVKKFI